MNSSGPPPQRRDGPPAAEVPSEARAPRSASVVLPTYNRSASLRRCLLGILGCDIAGLDLSLHVVDDGSTDDTEQMVAEVRRQYRGPVRLHYHRQQNQGAAAARNLGVAADDADLVLFIDDDCVPEQGWVRALVDASWNAGVGAVGGRIVGVGEGTWVSRYCRYLRFNEFPPDDRPIRFVNTANAAYRREVLRTLGGFEPAVSGGGEDHEIAWRAVRLGYRLVYQPAAVVRHYHRETVAVLAHTFWQRGYGSTLRDTLWGTRAAPTRGSLAAERWGQVGDALRLVLLPLRAGRMARRGVPARDLARFAWMDWLRQSANRRGRIAMQRRILRGEQRLERTTHAPPGSAPGPISPSPARLTPRG